MMTMESPWPVIIRLVMQHVFSTPAWHLSSNLAERKNSQSCPSTTLIISSFTTHHSTHRTSDNRFSFTPAKGSYAQKTNYWLLNCFPCICDNCAFIFQISPYVIRFVCSRISFPTDLLKNLSTYCHVASSFFVEAHFWPIMRCP